MARFIGVIQGQRGEASRLGSKKSGIRAEINGWKLGVRVYGGVNEQTGEDEFEVFLTTGSDVSGKNKPVRIGTFNKATLADAEWEVKK